MSRPLVTIAVVCHDRAHLLPRTMASVFDQRYRPVEILVVDDGSTDGTPALMAGYGDRIRYHRQANRGVAAARSAAGRLARGELIAFHDDDDLMVPERIELLRDALDAHPRAAFALGDWEVLDEAWRPTGQRSRCALAPDAVEPVLIEDAYAAILWPRLTPGPPQSLFRRADGERVGWFDERFFHACEDTDFFARCARLGPVVYVPRVVSLYRKQESSLTRDPLKFAASQFLLIEKHLRAGEGVDAALRARLRERMAGTLLQLAALRHRGSALPPALPEERVRRALSLVGWRERAAYHWLSRVKLPLRTWLLAAVRRPDSPAGG